MAKHEVGQLTVAIVPQMDNFIPTINRAAAQGGASFVSHLSGSMAKAGAMSGKAYADALIRAEKQTLAIQMSQASAKEAKAKDALTAATAKATEAEIRFNTAKAVQNQLEEKGITEGRQYEMAKQRTLITEVKLEEAQRKQALASEAATVASNNKAKAEQASAAYEEKLASQTAKTVGEYAKMATSSKIYTAAIDSIKSATSSLTSKLESPISKLTTLGTAIREKFGSSLKPTTFEMEVLGRTSAETGSKLSSALSAAAVKGSNLTAKLREMAGASKGFISSLTLEDIDLKKVAGDLAHVASSSIGALGSGFKSVGKIGSTVFAGLTHTVGRVGSAFTNFARTHVTRLFNSMHELGQQRLDNLDKAKATLLGLKVPAGQVSSILDDATKSATGTRYGMDQLAKAAGLAFAAGIKPGKEMVHYLSLVADTATATNRPIKEIIPIFDRIATTGRVYTRDVQQLANRGLPAWEIIRDAMIKAGAAANISMTDVRQAVKKGAVDAETILSGLQDKIGGLAVKMGTITREGAWENLKTALARIDAAFETDFFKQIGPFFRDLRIEIDRLAPAADALGNVFGKLGATVFGGLLKVVEKVISWFTELNKAMTFNTKSDSKMEQTIKTIDGLASPAEEGAASVAQLIDAVKRLGVAFKDIKDTIFPNGYLQSTLTRPLQDATIALTQFIDKSTTELHNFTNKLNSEAGTSLLDKIRKLFASLAIGSLLTPLVLIISTIASSIGSLLASIATEVATLFSALGKGASAVTAGISSLAEVLTGSLLPALATIPIAIASFLGFAVILAALPQAIAQLNFKDLIHDLTTLGTGLATMGKQFIQGFQDTGVIKALADLIQGLTTDVAGFVKAIADSGLMAEISGVAGILVATIAPILQTIFTNVMKIIKPLLPALSAIFAFLKQALQAILPTLTPIITFVIDLIGNVLTIITTGIGAVALLIAGIATLVAAIANRILSIVKPFIDNILNLSRGFIDSATNWITGLVTVINNLFNFLRSNLKVVVDFILALFASIPGLLNAYINAVIELLVKLGATILTNLKNVAVAVGNAFSGAFSKITNGIKGIFNGLQYAAQHPVEAVQALFQGLANAIKSIFSGIASFIGSVFTNVINGIKYWVNLAIGFLNKIIGGLNNVPGVNIPQIPTWQSSPLPPDWSGFTSLLPDAVQRVTTLSDGIDASEYATLLTQPVAAVTSAKNNITKLSTQINATASSKDQQQQQPVIKFPDNLTLVDSTGSFIARMRLEARRA